jgi:rhomboid protease GluP
MQILYQNLTGAQANRYGLILTACGILFHTQKTGNTWNILVDESNTNKTIKIVDAYLAENQPVSPFQNTLSLQSPRAYTGLWISAVIISTYLAIILSTESRLFMATFQSSVVRIMDGEYYRTVTSLFLHANAGHLIGNVIGISIFGTVVCRITGWGVGMLMILLSGGLGNLLNAFMYRFGHISIGASTAVFGAIGILSGYLFLVKFRQIQIKRTSWLPIGGSLALLAILSTGEHTDVTAHLYGMIVGLFFGILYAAWGIHLQKTVYQLLGVAIAICVVAGSFSQGLYR